MNALTALSTRPPLLRSGANGLPAAPVVMETAEVKDAVELSGTGPAPTPATPALDLKDLRKTIGRFPTGVTVVTTGEGDQRHGMTVSSFNSVSLDPPILSFCSMEGSGTLAAVQKNGTFAINVLAEDQGSICGKFAGKDPNKFAGAKFSAGTATGAPLLEGALARFECKVFQILQVGDHQLVLGQVVAHDRSAVAQKPLVFWGGNLQQQSASLWAEK